MKESFRLWLSRLGYALFLLVFVELSLQAFYYVTSGGFLFARVARPIWAPDSYSGFKNKPNLALTHNTNEFRTTIYTNSQGFRVPATGVEYALEKDPSTYRVMLLGPSFAFGWGVNYEETFAAKLETILVNKRFANDRRIEVINAGVNSLGTAAQLNWYRHVGKDYLPDLVIQFIYGSMAIDRTINSGYVVNPEGYLVPKEITTRQRLQQTLKRFATVFYAWMASARLDSMLEDKQSGGTIEGAGRELQLQDVFDPQSSKVLNALEVYDDLRSTVDSAGARLLVVYFPLSYTVHERDISRWKHLGVSNVEKQIAFDDSFCSFLRDRGIACLNLTQDLMRAATQSGERLYFWLDIHWTALGNDVAARTVAQHLLEPGARAPSSQGGADPD